MTGYSRFLPNSASTPPARSDSIISSPVTLHIYDVSSRNVVKKVNNVLSSMGTGAFHAGVEIHGQEWSFGSTTDGSTGIYVCLPGKNAAHQYIKAVPMGETRCTQKDVRALIQQLAEEWQGSDYDLLRCNCCHFSSELCKMLGVGSAPPWLFNLSDAGVAIDDSVQAAKFGVSNLRTSHRKSEAGHNRDNNCNKPGVGTALQKMASNLSGAMKRMNVGRQGKGCRPSSWNQLDEYEIGQ
jgi:hypothetical protein